MSRVYETAIKIGASISKAFRSDTYNAATALTKLTAATKQLKEAEKAAAAYKKLDDELGRSKGRLDAASDALQRLKAAEKAAGGATKESMQWRKAGERAVAKSSREFDRASKAADKNGESLRKMGVDTAKLASEQERLARTLAATERQEKALTRYEASRERLFGARHKTPLVQKAGEQMRGVASDAMLLGTAAVGAGAAMAGLVLKTLHAGDEIGDTADKLGIASTALQELRYGARQSGDELGYIDNALSKMLINVGKHKLAKGKAGALAIPGLQMFPLSNSEGTGTGAGAVVDPFKQIGLKAKDLAKLKPEEQLKKIADGMLKLKTQADRAAVAQLIFGKGAKEIDPFLKEGSAGIERLAKSEHKYGGVMSEEAVRNADLADKAMKDAEMAVAGLVTTLTADLLPVATRVFKEFSGWVAGNRGEIKKWAEGAAKWIEGKGIPAFKHITADIASFGGKVLWLVNGAARLAGGFDNLGIAIVALRLAPLTVTLGKIAWQGGKAAKAVYDLASAVNAQRASGGLVGLDGKPIGSAIGLAANAAMLLGAASIGLAIGTYLDEKFHISDDAEHAAHILTGKDDELNEGDRAAKKSAWDIFKAGIFGGTAGVTDAAVKAQADAMRSKATAATLHPGSTAGVHIAPVIHIHDAKTRDDIAKGMDKAKQEVLDAHDKREAHRRRVSFGR